MFAALLVLSIALHASAAEDSIETQITTPAEAYNAWAAKDATPKTKQAAVSYLQSVLDSATPDSALFLGACNEMAKIFTANKDFKDLIAIRQRQLDGAGGDIAKIYAAAVPLSDAFALDGDNQSAADILVQTLEKYPSPSHFAAVWTKLTLLYRGLKQDDQVIRVCAMLLSRESDPQVIFPVATLLATTYSGLKDYENAAKVWENFLARNRDASSAANIVAATKSLVGIQLTNMNRPDLAVQTFDRETKAFPEGNPDLLAGLLIPKAAILFGENDFTDAIIEYEAAIDLLDVLPATLAPTVFFNYSRACREVNDLDRAAKLFLQELKKYDLSLCSQIVSLLIDLPCSQDQMMEAVGLLHEKVGAGLSVNKLADSYQCDIIRLLVSAGKSNEALSEGRVMLYTCPEKSIPVATERIAWVFKSSDGNLGRANTFLKFQKFGMPGEDGKAGTENDLPDLLADIPPVSDPRRNAVYESFMDSLPTDWMGFKRRGDVLVYLDRYADALQAYRRAFELCPMSEKELQAVTDAATTLIIRVAKDIPLAERFVQYVMFGPAGMDGRVGTSDDIKDPLPEIVSRFPSSGGKPKATRDDAKAAKAQE